MHEQGTMCQLRRWPQALHAPGSRCQAGDPGLEEASLHSSCLGTVGDEELKAGLAESTETELLSDAGAGLLLVQLRHGQGRLALCIPLIHVDAHLPKEAT